MWAFTTWPKKALKFGLKVKLCGSRKYPYPLHTRNWKFRRGRGSKTQEITEGS